ncbi:MAG: FecCD family ABC transporter permease, partial [Oscillospiraceae bacterium]
MTKRESRRYEFAFAGLLLALGVLIFLNLASGSVKLSAGDILDVLFHRTGESTAIIWDIRLPRILAAILLGGALSVSGFLLQTFFANPIAGPFVLGISSGAKLAVSLTLIGFLSRGISIGSAALILAAFVGAMLSMGFVLLISRRVKKMSMLIISGVMIGYICSAVTDFVVTFADDSNIVNLHNWALGSFSGVSWENVRVIAVVVLTALALTFLLSKPIGAYQLGEVYAQNMGVNIRTFRAALILL